SLARGQGEDGANRRIEAEAQAIDDDALSLLGGKAEEVVAVAVAVAVDGRIDRHLVRLVRAVVRLNFTHFGQAAANLDNLRPADAVLASRPHLVSSGRNIAGNGHLELVGFLPGGLETGMIETQLLDLLEILAADFQEHF